MEEIGELLGIIIIIFYALAVSKYIIRKTNKILEKALINNDKVFIFYNKAKNFIMKRHSIFGMLAILFIITHFITQYISKGINIFGLIAASLMLFQVLLGIYGANVKKKWKHWIALHRLIALTILIAIFVHII